MRHVPPHHPERIEGVGDIGLSIHGPVHGPIRVGFDQIRVDGVQVALQFGGVIVQISREAHLGRVKPLQLVGGTEKCFLNIFFTSVYKALIDGLPEQISVVSKRRALDEAQTTQNPETRGVHGAFSTPS